MFIFVMQLVCFRRCREKNMFLYLATTNKHKTREIAHRLKPLNIEVHDVGKLGGYQAPEETGKAFLDNARLKALALKNFLSQSHDLKYEEIAILADDSGLVCDDLKGAPGVYSARFAGLNATDAQNNAKLVSEMNAVTHATRRARYVCALSLILPDGRHYDMVETCEGLIVLEPKGIEGFGYDPHFYVESHQKTMAELSLDVKNQISHRGKALQRLERVLQNYSKA